ncbi:uroporphyrinogen decarboxylase family protein [Vallitalea okinawensis]|uniref:uroporphyrinogen decarboxylase family protein n=1 Tax=Vallitalea okinawensis TaxID=2078660 RepID=UPI000CFC7E76|nr:uroporphyrinogen decarboxylase family protein [Vallitalea okinawensis]
MGFEPNYTHVLNAASNIQPKRLPLYEHAINEPFIDKVINKNITELMRGTKADRQEYMRYYINFFKDMGYDTISFERCITSILPDGGALGGHKKGIIQSRQDFKRYPWGELKDKFFSQFSEDFELLREEMPQGMKAIGGVGNGVFECVQDLVGYTDLCLILFDDPELFRDLFIQSGKIILEIWNEFLKKYGDMFCVYRFGDDLGFKDTTLLSPDTIRNHIIPEYKKVVDLVHSYHKPFLLHSCGNIFPIMEDLLNVVKIDAKHSNEDVIAPFSFWIDQYGDRIGNFGGVDVGLLCQGSEQEIKAYVKDVIKYSTGHKGFAFGSGNSIPEYIPVEGYLAMIEAAREARGE